MGEVGADGVRIFSKRFPVWPQKAFHQ